MARLAGYRVDRAMRYPQVVLSRRKLRPWLLALVLLVGCGRVGYDPRAGVDDGGVDANVSPNEDGGSIDAGNAGVVMAAADHVIFEAEIGVGEWTIVSLDNPVSTRSGTILLDQNSNASGSSAIWSNENATAIPALAPISWRIRFQNTGTYRLFARFSLVDTDSTFANYAAEDSAFMSPILDADVDGTRQLTPPDVGLMPGDPGTEGNYIWFDDGQDFIVTDAHVSAPSVSFSLGRREEGFSIDRFAFVDVTSSIVLADLDALPNSPVVP